MFNKSDFEKEPKSSDALFNSLLSYFNWSRKIYWVELWDIWARLYSFVFIMYVYSE